MARKNVHCVTAAEGAGYDKLVELHNGNEAAAFEEWENNGYKVPDRAMALVGEDVLDNKFVMQDLSETDPVILNKQHLVKKAKATLTAKVRALEKVIERHPGFQAVYDDMNNILDEIDIVEAEETLINFIAAADKLTKFTATTMEKFRNGQLTPTLENIKRLEDAVASFSLLKELREDMFENEEHMEIFKTVESIIGRTNKIHNEYIKTARKLLADQLQGNFHKVVRLYEKKAEQAFNQYKKPHLEKSEIPQARAEFINQYMIANATEIDIRTTAYIENLLLHTVDIPALTAWAVNPKDMNHDIISIAVDSLDEADMRVWNAMETIVDDTESLNAAFIGYVGASGDPKKQYEMFFTRDENGEIEPEIISKNHPDYNEFFEKYHNVPAVWNLYTHMVNMIEEKNKMVFRNKRLGKNKDGYGLPKIEKENLERLYSEGFITMAKQGFLDKFKLRGKDVDLGLITEHELNQQKANKASGVEEVYISESGEERGTIPLFYRTVNVSAEEQSYDVLKGLVLDYHNSLRFKTKTENAVFLQVLKDVMHEVDIIQTTSFVRKLKVNKDTKDIHTVKGNKSQIVQTLEDLIEHRIYDMKIKGDPKTAKIYQSLGRYTSLVTMGANYLSGAANLLHGSTMSWIEALGGNTGYFTPKDRAKAVFEYDKNLAGLMADVNERTPKNKINLLIRRFNAFSESEMLNHKSYVQNNRLKRNLDNSALLMFNNIGEHAMQSIVMLSVMNNIKVKDVNGNYLNGEFKPTKNRNEAIGVADAMLQDGSKLEFHPSVNSTERTNGVGPADITKISRMIRRINRDLYGNYDSENKARYQRTGAGALVGQMRGWLIPGMQKRWRGIGTSQLFSKEFMRVGEEYNFENLHRLSYNTEIDEFEEGQYVTTFRFLRTAASEMKALRSIAGSKEAWNAMDDQQKARVKKTVLELGMAIGFLLLSLAFEDDKEDPDDMANIYAAYITRRMYSELFTFANPEETVRTFRSPAIAISSVENAIEILKQLVDPFEQYETGRHFGEYKLWRDIKKLVPVVKQFDRNVEDSYLFLTK